MEDGYKELIEKLHNIGDAPIGKHWSVLIDKSTLRDVIDVIERLVRERDDYEILAKMYAKVSEDLCVRTKERDAAVKDLHGYCWCCTKVKEHCFPTNDKDCKNWEWRGVQK